MEWTRLAFVPFLICALTACPKKKVDASDAAAEASVAATDAAPAGPEATNADAIARFPDETPIDHQAATVQWASNNARKSPPSGDVVATLPKGTNVVQIASHDKYILITFDNPKNAGERLEGWVLKDVFSAQPAVLPKSACPAGQTLLQGDETFCGKICKVDTDCAGGQACTGTAQIAHDGGTGDTVHNCVAIVHTDGGAPTPAPKDAGGGGGGGPPAGPMVMDPGAGNTCAANYKLAGIDNKCHRSCTPATGVECAPYGANVICTRGGYCKTR